MRRAVQSIVLGPATQQRSPAIKKLIALHLAAHQFVTAVSPEVYAGGMDGTLVTQRAGVRAGRLAVEHRSRFAWLH